MNLIFHFLSPIFRDRHSAFPPAQAYLLTSSGVPSKLVVKFTLSFATTGFIPKHQDVKINGVS
ncbi:MAG: hypothetical protein COX20_02420 [Desulfobacterales bacterium CG23_combo_of_CG06-09_8_20_14_all_52_9]|nr:MAG: hypothetical protein COX20_02420 [Desulfobacterales bacterium CG23_combo_of_CG06-09_8_20_14_all_52_9]